MEVITSVQIGPNRIIYFRIGLAGQTSLRQYSVQFWGREAVIAEPVEENPSGGFPRPNGKAPAVLQHGGGQSSIGIKRQREATEGRLHPGRAAGNRRPGAAAAPPGDPCAAHRKPCLIQKPGTRDPPTCPRRPAST